MNRGRDSITGLLLALVGIGIIVLWKSGALKNALGISAPAERGAPSVTQQITRIGAPDVATKLPTLSLAPLAISPQGPGSTVASAGLTDNGFSSTWIGSASYAAFRAGERLASMTPVAIITGGGGGGVALSAV